MIPDESLDQPFPSVGIIILDPTSITDETYDAFEESITNLLSTIMDDFSSSLDDISTISSA